MMQSEPITNWIGRQDTAYETLHAGPAQGLAATLNLDPEAFSKDGTPIPPLWNWLYFLPRALTDQLGPDGHPKRGGFLPPIPLARRMWAGSRCQFLADLRLGDRVTKTSTISKIAEKVGRTGPMVFVTVVHEIDNGEQIVFREEQDLVYMDIPAVFSPPEAVILPECKWNQPVSVDPVLLFRFSALTFNGHRIHYDRDYATQVENYPGLVVHGPLQAIVAFDAACRQNPNRHASGFRFRGMRPLFDFDAVSISGVDDEDMTTRVFTANGDGAIAMEARIDWS